MTKSILTAAVCLASVFAAVPASAQMTGGMKVNLPYAAQVGPTTLPAGQYTIRDVTDDGSVSILEFTPANGHVAAVAMVQRISLQNAPGKTEVVLRPAGDKYMVDRIWLEGCDYGFELLSSTARH